MYQSKFVEVLQDYLSSSKFVDENFFFISSDSDLRKTKTKLYGYAINDDSILINVVGYRKPIDVASPGCYVQTIVDENKIVIKQDYFGCYGLYLYKEEDYFAISNSFIYLLNNLKSKKLSINKNFVRAFVNESTAILSGFETMISEIELLPRNCMVQIDKNNKKIKIDIIENEESDIPVNSESGIAIIDKWHEKWSGVAKSLLRSNIYLSCDLSGGKDSRAALSCLFSPLQDLNQIQFNSAKGNIHTLSDDFKIASNISDKMNFQLNRISSLCKRIRQHPFISLANSFLAKAGFHKELMCQNFLETNPRFNINGMVADLRDFWSMSVEDFINENIDRSRFNSIETKKALKELLRSNVKKIQASSSLAWNEAQHTAKDYFYRNIRVRHQYGRVSLEFFLSNIISLSPLLDPSLYRLNQKIDEKSDFDLLYAIIYDRYIPELNKTTFDSNRSVSTSTWDMARKINSKFSKPIAYKQIEFNIAENLQHDTEIIKEYTEFNSPIDLLLSEVREIDFLKFINSFLGDEVLNHAQRYLKEHNYHSYVFLAGLYEIYLICQLLLRNKNIAPSNIFTRKFGFELYNNNGISNEIFNILKSARIDILNQSSNTNTINLVRASDPNLYVETPKPLVPKFGNSKVIQSRAGYLSIEFQSNESGIIIVKFTAPYLKISGKLLDIKTDFNFISISNLSTGVIIESTNKQISTSQLHPNVIKFEVKANDKIKIECQWYAYIYSPDELSEIFKECYKQNIKNYKFWNVYRSYNS